MSNDIYISQLKNIKQYLHDNLVFVDSVYMWQSGFTHDGTQYGCDILARCYVRDEEVTYAVPKHILLGDKQLPFLEINRRKKTGFVGDLKEEYEKLQSKYYACSLPEDKLIHAMYERQLFELDATITYYLRNQR